MTEANILVIEDDEIVSRTIERSLRGNDFRISTVSSGVEGLKTARRMNPDLVILDVIMPGMDGYTVCKEMRADPLLSKVPVLFLTAKVKDEDKINGFHAGADDYLSKPFNIDELILRVRAILRRTEARVPAAVRQVGLAMSRERTVSPRPEVVGTLNRESRPSENGHCLVVGEYILDTRSYELNTPDKGKLRLTPVQYDLLYHLMSHPSQIFSPARLLDEVWDYPSDTGSPDLVRVHIKNLRERIEIDSSKPRFIRTVPGYGYTVNPEN